MRAPISMKTDTAHHITTIAISDYGMWAYYPVNSYFWQAFAIKPKHQTVQVPDPFIELNSHIQRTTYRTWVWQIVDFNTNFLGK